MDQFKIKMLSARHSDFNLDRMDFSRRVASEHYFSNTDEAINYLYKIINNEPLNPDDISFTSYKQYPVLVINIVDEAVCTIIHELFLQRSRRDPANLGYIRVKLRDFLAHLSSVASHTLQQNIEYRYYYELILLMTAICDLSIPTDLEKEEYKHYLLSIKYYDLMYSLYENARPVDEYFTRNKEYYYELLKERNKHYEWL